MLKFIFGPKYEGEGWVGKDPENGKFQLIF